MKMTRKFIAMIIAAVMCVGLISVPAMADTDVKTLDPSDKWWVQYTSSTGAYDVKENDYIRAHGSGRSGFLVFDASQLTMTDGSVGDYVANAPSIILELTQSKSSTTDFESKVYGIWDATDEEGNVTSSKSSQSKTAAYDKQLFDAGKHIINVKGTGTEVVTADVTDYVKAQEDGKYVFKIAGQSSGNAQYNPCRLIFDYSDGAKAKSAIDGVTLSDNIFSENFTLPTEGKFDTVITWSSSDSAIAIDGANAVVTRPTEEEGDKEVTLTASVTVGEATETKEFTVTVPAVITADIIKAFPTADSYAQKSNPDTNFNDKKNFYINGSGRQNFIRFNVTDVNADEIGEAVLNLYFREINKPADGKDNFGITLYGLSGQDKTSWEESTLTYNVGAELGLLDSSESYGSGELLGVQTVKYDEVGTMVSIDVTDYVKSQTDGVYALRFCGDSITAYLDTRECETAEQRPYLEISRGDTGAVISDTKALTLDAEVKAGSLTLPVSGSMGSAIAWSTDSDLISIDGASATVSDVQTETKVTLTATVTKGESEKTKDFEITIIPAARDAIRADKEALAIQNQVSESFILPVKGEQGSDISWASDNALITIEGANASVSEVDEETAVTLTATLTNGAYTETKEFEVTIIPVDAQKDVDADASDSALHIPSAVQESFTLPTEGAHGSTITWVSGNPGVIAIDGANAVVAEVTEDTTVTLTATVSKKDKSTQRSFDVKVLATGSDTSEADAAADNTALSVPETVSGDFTLTIKGEHGSDISWVSDSDLIVIDGANARVTATGEPTDVHLTATVTKGAITKTRTFTVKVMPVGNADTAADLAAISVPGNIYEKLILPIAGEHGSEITWTTDSDLITINGALITAARPSEKTNAVLTAVVKNGQFAESKKFTVTVLPNMISAATDGKEITSFTEGQKMVVGLANGVKFNDGEKMHIATYGLSGELLHLWYGLDSTAKIEINADGNLGSIGVFVWKNDMEPVACEHIRKTAE